MLFILVQKFHWFDCWLCLGQTKSWLHITEKIVVCPLTFSPRFGLDEDCDAADGVRITICHHTSALELHDKNMDWKQRADADMKKEKPNDNVIQLIAQQMKSNQKAFEEALNDEEVLQLEVKNLEGKVNVLKYAAEAEDDPSIKQKLERMINRVQQKSIGLNIKLTDFLRSGSSSSRKKGHYSCDWSWVFDEVPLQEKDLCWLYAVVGVLEARFFINYGHVIEISMQELLDKVRKNATIGKTYPCTYNEAFTWICNNGVCLKKYYTEFVGIKQQAQERPSKAVLLMLNKVEKIDPTNDDDILHHFKKGPLVAKLKVEVEQYKDLRDSSVEPKLYTTKLAHTPTTTYPHAVILTGARSYPTGMLDVRDTNQRYSPGNGEYHTKISSSLNSDELHTITRVLYPKLVFLRRVKK